MYTYYPGAGTIVRNSDGVVVAPTNDMESAGYLDWLAWCALGNSATLGLEEVAASGRMVTRLQFRRLFTFAERVAIDASLDPVVRTFLTDLAMTSEVDLEDSDVIGGLAYLEGVSLIASGRAAEIRA